MNKTVFFKSWFLKRISILVLILSPHLLLAAGPSSKKEPRPLSAVVLENGMVAVMDQSNMVASVCPQLFGEGYKGVYFGFGDYRKAGDTHGHFTLPDGTVVDVKNKIDRLPNGLHFHYSFTAPKTFRMSMIRAMVAMPYADWDGAPYQLKDKNGEVPRAPVTDHVITQDSSAPLTLGPASKLEGLTINLDNQGYQLTLQDDRQWTPQLLAYLTHGEPADKTWDWKAGEEKTFDFTLTFNRKVDPYPSLVKGKKKGLEGYWHGIYTLDGLERGRVAAFFEKDAKGKWKPQIYFDSADVISYSSETPHLWVKGKNLKAQYSDGTLLMLKLNPTGESLEGTGNYHGKSYGVTLTRGADFRVPRVDAQGQAVTDYVYQAPQDLGDGWETGDLASAQIDAPKITQGVDRILDGTFPRLQSLVLIRHGKLLLDEYFYGYGPQQAHPLFSTTKSFFSTLFGVAQDRGLVNVSQKLYDLYPEYRQKPDWDPRKDSITLGNILAMDSGFDCDDMGGASHHRNLWGSTDWVDYCLSLPLNPDFKNHWVYNGTCLHPISAYLAKKSGMSIPDFADKYLFGPLGIPSPRWSTGPHQVTEVDSGLWLKPREMAKLGQLYLDKGMWKGQRIVSQKWIEAVNAPKGQEMDPTWWHKYGYLWWLREMNINGRMVPVAEANGYGGQMIWVVPDDDLVCVMTSGNYDFPGMVDLPDSFLREYILPAVKR
jgi:CubicO group peptidase (beta-lactamase class C family)